MQPSSLFFLLVLLLSFLHNSSAIPQGVYEIIVPPGDTLPGCVTSYASPFGILAVEGPPRNGEILRTCNSQSSLSMTLTNGVLIDSLGRIGSIVANRQFQFDGPPAQAGAIYTGGWSVCSDGALALGASKQFYQCASSDFMNIYDQCIANYCMPITLEITDLVNC